MSSSPGARQDARPLRAAIVLGTTEDECTVVIDGEPRLVPYAPHFPRPRAERVSPGHLVAVTTAGGGPGVVVWRWFDAVVIAPTGPGATLWEPGHGVVEAQPRDPRSVPPPGSRAYLSAGLPGAEWWLAGPAVERAENADVELDEVREFLTSHGLWEQLG